MIQQSNRFELVAREHIHGIIQGIDFGYNMSCLIRSPKVALLWSGGTAYTSGRQSQYGSSGMRAIPRNDHHWVNHREYKDLGPEGGRLSMARLLLVSAEINELFEEDLTECLPLVAKRQTLLIEGGGSAFQSR